MQRLGLFVALGLWGCAHRVNPRPAPQGGMLSEDLHWALDETALRLITTADREVLALPVNRPFVTAQRTAITPGERGGQYALVETVAGQCDQSTIDTLDTAMGTLTMQGRLSGNNCTATYRLSIALLPSGDGLTISVDVDGDGIQQTALTLNSRLGEQVLGLGAQHDGALHSGRTLPMVVEENLSSSTDTWQDAVLFWRTPRRDAPPTSLPIPFLMTTDHRSVAMDGTALGRIDLSSHRHITLSQWQPTLSATLHWANDPQSLVAMYTGETGRPQPLPDWAHGTLLGVQGGTVRVETLLAEARQAGVDVSGLVLQDWDGRRAGMPQASQWGEWTTSAVDYPDIADWLSDLIAQDVHVLAQVTPFLPVNSQMAETAVAQQLLVTHTDGRPYVIYPHNVPAYLLDLSNPDAEAWASEQLRAQVVDVGFSGWLSDGGQWLPFDAKLHCGESPLLWHNRYAVEWARIQQDVANAANRPLLIISDSGFTGSTTHTSAFTMGDQQMDWGMQTGLPAAISAVTTAGLSGLAITHSDTGGTTPRHRLRSDTHRSAELLTRWTEFSAFTPIFRTHEGWQPQHSHQVYASEEALTQLAALSQLHQALHPLFVALEEEAVQTGLPVVRHPHLVFPEDPKTIDLHHQFFVGDDLLVIPVHQAKAAQAQGYVPQGQWQHIWTGQMLNGPGTFRVDAPLGRPAAFVRVGGTHSDLIHTALSPLVDQ